MLLIIFNYSVSIALPSVQSFFITKMKFVKSFLSKQSKSMFLRQYFEYTSLSIKIKHIFLSEKIFSSFAPRFSNCRVSFLSEAIAY